MEAAADTRLKGKRVQDGEKCSATFLSKEERDEDLDLYEVLGLDDEVDQKEIKKAYRKLSLRYHPDKCKKEVEVTKADGTTTTEDCAKLMNRVTLAYEVLGDEDKRILYEDAMKYEATKDKDEGDQGPGGEGGPFQTLHIPFGWENRERELLAREPEECCIQHVGANRPYFVRDQLEKEAKEASQKEEGDEAKEEAAGRESKKTG